MTTKDLWLALSLVVAVHATLIVGVYSINDPTDPHRPPILRLMEP